MGGVGCVCGACVGRAGGWVWVCVGRACCAISVGIARSALLSGYLGKSGDLPRSILTKKYKQTTEILHMNALCLDIFHQNQLLRLKLEVCHSVDQ